MTTPVVHTKEKRMSDSTENLDVTSGAESTDQGDQVAETPTSIAQPEDPRAPETYVDGNGIERISGVRSDGWEHPGEIPDPLSGETPAEDAGEDPAAEDDATESDAAEPVVAEPVVAEPVEPDPAPAQDA